MRLLKLIAGGIVTIAAALMISYWPYNFVELFPVETSTRWSAGHFDIFTTFGPRKFEALYMFQIKHHYDIAAEIPLSWDYHHVFPNYAIWYDYELTSEFGRETWMAAEVMGPFLKIFRDPYSSLEEAKAAIVGHYESADDLIPSGKRHKINHEIKRCPCDCGKPLGTCGCPDDIKRIII